MLTELSVVTIFSFVLVAGSADPAAAAAAETSPPADPAIASLRLELLANPDDAGVHHGLGVELRRLGRLEEALVHFERAVGLGHAERRRLGDLGAAYADLSRYREAEATYRKILDLNPEDAGAFHSLAHIAFLQGDFDRAIELGRKAIAIDPRHFFATYHLGQVLAYAGRNDEAEMRFRQVLALEPAGDLERLATVDTLYQLGSIHLSDGRFESAEKLLSRVVELAPEHAGAHYARARALRRLGRDAEADRAIRIHLDLRAGLEPTGPTSISR